MGLHCSRSGIGKLLNTKVFRELNDVAALLVAKDRSKVTVGAVDQTNARASGFFVPVLGIKIGFAHSRPKLFHEHRHLRRLTLPHHTPNPFHFARAGGWPGFAAAYYPVDAFEGFLAELLNAVRSPSHVGEFDWPQQRLHAQESHYRWHLEEVRNAFVRGGLVLHRGAEPEIAAHAGFADAGAEIAETSFPRHRREHRRNVLWPLREQEPVKMRRVVDEAKEAGANVLHGDSLARTKFSPRRIATIVRHDVAFAANHRPIPRFKHIRQTGAEDAASLAGSFRGSIPRHRLPPLRLARHDARSLRAPHAEDERVALAQSIRITKLTSGRYFGTATPRV